MKHLVAAVVFAICLSKLSAQPSEPYLYLQDSAVATNLEHWRDLKFGIIIHWGIYAIPGIVESWSICNEDWVGRDTSWNYEAYKEWYWSLSNEFNPTHFNPQHWAEISKQAGMKYLVFTTKHHDGFCMWDSKFSNYGVKSTPYAKNENYDIVKQVFDRCLFFKTRLAFAVVLVGRLCHRRSEQQLRYSKISRTLGRLSELYEQSNP
jgi:alpha-L-fucosidase